MSALVDVLPPEDAGRPTEFETRNYDVVAKALRKEGITIEAMDHDEGYPREERPFVMAGIMRTEGRELGLYLNTMKEKDGEWSSYRSPAKEMDPERYVRMVIRNHRRRKIWQASGMKSITYPCFHDIHVLAQSWLTHEKIDLRHAFQHDGHDLGEEFAAEVAHTNGNWGKLKVNRFFVADGRVAPFGMTNRRSDMIFLDTSRPSLMIQLDSPESIPETMVHGIVGRRLDQVIDLPFSLPLPIRIIDSMKVMQDVRNKNGQMTERETTLTLILEDVRVVLEDLPEGIPERLPHWLDQTIRGKFP